jgi:hypothetical protein
VHLGESSHTARIEWQNILAAIGIPIATKDNVDQVPPSLYEHVGKLLPASVRAVRSFEALGPLEAAAVTRSCHGL